MNTPAMTPAQVRHIKNLLRTNNKYRAKQVTIDELIEKHYRGEYTIATGSHLIDRYIKENLVCAQEEQHLNQIYRHAKRRKTLFASDFIHFDFCKISFSNVLRETPNLNFYELNRGLFYHQQLEAPKDSGHELTMIDQALRFLGKIPKDLLHFKIQKYLNMHFNLTMKITLPEANDLLMTGSRFDLSGCPDLIGIHKDKTRSVIEVKTISSDEFKLNNGHIFQNYSYVKLVGEHYAINANHYIIYLKKGEIIGHHSYAVTKGLDDKWRSTFFEMTKITKTIPKLNFNDVNYKKCSSCGYRQYCEATHSMKSYL